MITPTSQVKSHEEIKIMTRISQLKVAEPEAIIPVQGQTVFSAISLHCIPVGRFLISIRGNSQVIRSPQKGGMDTLTRVNCPSLTNAE